MPRAQHVLRAQQRPRPEPAQPTPRGPVGMALSSAPGNGPSLTRFLLHPGGDALAHHGTPSTSDPASEVYT